MNIDISQYRAIIGTFNSKYNITKVQQIKSTRKISYKYQLKKANIYKYVSYLFIFYVVMNLYGREVDYVSNTIKQTLNNINHNEDTQSLYSRHSYLIIYLTIKYHIINEGSKLGMKCQYFKYTNLYNFQSKYVN